MLTHVDSFFIKLTWVLKEEKKIKREQILVSNYMSYKLFSEKYFLMVMMNL